MQCEQTPTGGGDPHFVPIGTVDLSSTDTAAITNGLAHGTYRLVETTVPSGFLIVGEEDYVEFTVSSAGKVEITHCGTITNTSGQSVAQATVSPDTATETTPAVITVKNQPGKALPTTGGPGTLALTLFGSALIVISGIMLIARRRPAASHARPSVKRGGR